MTTPDILATIQADSTQINADDLAQQITVTVTGLSKGTAEQPINIELAEFPGRVYRPCKSMRRVLVQAWGADATTYIGRRITLFNDPTVKWGGAAVGGVRIAALSHIDKPLTIALTVTRGRRAPFIVQPLNGTPMEIRNFLHRISEATLDDLDKIAVQLKARDLGPHKVELQKAWAARKSELAQPADDDDALDAAQEAEVSE